MHHLPESRDTANPLLESASKGREEIISSLMNMNARYEKLLNEVQLIMEQLVETLKRQGKEHKEVSFVLVVKPLLIPIPPRSFINDSRPSCDYVLSFQLDIQVTFH